MGLEKGLSDESMPMWKFKPYIAVISLRRRPLSGFETFWRRPIPRRM